MIDIGELRKAFGTYITGVTVVTTRTKEGRPVGFTANSFTSVSLEPPLLLVCPAKSLQCLPVFEECAHFTVNVLAENQHNVSNVFAKNNKDRFEQVQWHNDQWDIPIIEGAVSYFSCRSFQRVDAGDHIILLGEVLDFSTQGSTGLGYANGGYFTQNVDVNALAIAQQSNCLQVGAIIECDGQVFVDRKEDKWILPSVECSSLEESVNILEAHLSSLALDICVSQIYSIFQNNKGKYTVFYRCVAQNITSSDRDKYVAIPDLDVLKFSDSAVRSMMERYQNEDKKKHFGLYIGGEITGEIYT